MADTTATVDATKCARNITVTVRVRRLWRVRLGLYLIRLGCWIAGLNYQGETDDA